MIDLFINLFVNQVSLELEFVWTEYSRVIQKSQCKGLGKIPECF